MANGSLDRIYASPKATRTKGHYVLIYGITTDDKEVSLGLNGKKIIEDMGPADVREAVLFQILGCGAKVPEEISDEVGHFCVSVSSALNPVAGLGNSRYALVHCDTIASVLDCEQMAMLGAVRRSELVKAEKKALEEKAALKKKANGVCNV